MSEELIELGGPGKKGPKVRLARGLAVAKAVQAQLEPYVRDSVIVGSIRRERPEVSDVELVVLPEKLPAFLRHVQSLGFSGGDRIQRARIKGLKVELYIAHTRREMGAMLLTYTGDWAFNIILRTEARRQGWKLNQYGLWDVETGAKILQSSQEKPFFRALRIGWKEPKERNYAGRFGLEKTPERKPKLAAVADVPILRREWGGLAMTLYSPSETGTEAWLLRVERVDPWGNASEQVEFTFDDAEVARFWFDEIDTDEDVEFLMSQELDDA